MGCRLLKVTSPGIALKAGAAEGFSSTPLRKGRNGVVPHSCVDQGGGDLQGGERVEVKLALACPSGIFAGPTGADALGDLVGVLAPLESDVDLGRDVERGDVRLADHLEGE